MLIPCIDIGPLYEPDSADRARTDAAFLHAAEQAGFIQVTGFGSHLDIGAARRGALKRIFELPPDRLRRLWRRKFAPDHRNVYRGWFPLQAGHPTYKEGIDLGPDILPGHAADPADPLCEPSPLPEERLLPGWRASVVQHYAQMARLGQVLMRALARGMNLDESHFDALFVSGISTLRLIHYPRRSDQVSAGVVGAAHVDSGLLTLLVQDGVSGLQVRASDGCFVDVSVRADAVTVNFGRLLALWSGGRVRATEHRVVGGVQSRHSFAFFYEPRVDALIEPLPGATRCFAPFQYGDFLWQASTRFLEFRGMESLRAARGNAAAALAAIDPEAGRNSGRQMLSE